MPMLAQLLLSLFLATVQCTTDTTNSLCQPGDDRSKCTLAEGEEELVAHTSLLQTILKVEPVKTAKTEHTELLSVSSKVRTLSNSTYMIQNGLYHLSKDACAPIWPMEVQLQYSVLSNMNLLPSRRVCKSWRPPKRSVSLLSSAIGQIHDTHKQVLHPSLQAASKTHILLFAYFLVMAVVLLSMIRTVYKPPPSNKPWEASQRRPEAEAWRDGLRSWISISWATPWIQRWGHATDKISIKAGDLGLIGDPEDECKQAIRIFSAIYKDELAKRSKHVLWASLFRYIGWKKLALTVCAALMYEGMMYLGPTYVVHWILNSLTIFYFDRAMGKHITMEDYFPTIIGIISMLTVAPIVMTGFITITNLVTCRINMRMQACLASAIYQKAQRLPACQKNYDLTDDDVQQAKDDWGIGLDAPKEYSVVQLMSSDVNTYLVGIILACMSVMTTTPILVILGYMLIYRLGKAILYAFISIAVFIILVGVCAMMMIHYLGKTQYAAGARMAFFQEMMFGIRVMKSYAWEDAGRNRINEIRTYEVTNLTMYWRWLGTIIGLCLTAPRATMIICLVGYFRCYGSMDAEDMFTFVQILNAFQGAATVWSGCIPVIMSLGPCVARIEKFLSLPDADLPCEKTAEAVPKWVTAWPKEIGDGESPPELQLKGSFSWSQGAKSVLCDIDFCVATGEKVAVVGEVGSGKTTFLQALCGDLYPVGDARLSLPEKLAYHAQVPHVIEGTLKENVLFYHQYDEELYNSVLHAACLNRDLEVLPGGDAVPIGSRGITLSGGQRARVSLARAAYCKSAKVLLLDDPLASVDGPTGQHIIQNLFKGPLLEGRTLVCVCQPHPDIMQSFDRVFVIKDGRIAVQGAPADAIKSEEFKALMSQNDSTDFDYLKQSSNALVATTKSAASPSSNKSEAQQLRDEETEGGFQWSVLKNIIFIGGWKRLFLCFAFYIGMIVTTVLGDVSLARWANEVMYEQAVRTVDPMHLGVYKFVSAWNYIRVCCLWCFLGMLQFAWSWYLGCVFTIRISEVLHTKIMGSLMRAPIDRFYDKTPVGRILNRMSSDLSNLDQKMFCQVTSTSAQFCWLLIPIVYIHWTMPLAYTCIAVFIYVPMIKIFYKYINVVVPLRYLTNITRSEVNIFSSEVDSSRTSVRSYQVQQQIAGEMCVATDNLLKAQFAGDCVKRWTSNRFVFFFSVMATTMAIIATIMPYKVNLGQLSVCLSAIIFFTMKLDFVLDMMTSAQFEFVCMNRLYEYTDLPSERPFQIDSDAQYASWTAHFPRFWLHIAGKLLMEEGPSGVQINWVHEGTKYIIFEEVPGEEEFKVHDQVALAICHTIAGLERMTMGHRITACNDAVGDARKIAEDYVKGESDQIRLRIESTWLRGGCRVQITDLVAGYADTPSNVLKGINATIEAKTKAAIVGTTGCGKSTMILCLLRVLEPRAGRIMINNVDTQDVGLKTLRTCIGLVPQDPFVFSGTIRNNLDPFLEHGDTRLWNALKAVQLADFIKNLGQGLNFMCTADGGNLSFGQRQLLCVARMIVRQPSLLLLDECTSAIDPRTQELVQEALRKCFPDSTLLVIAHRLETILDFDIVLCLEQGRVVEKGSVKALAGQTGGVFAKMLAAR